MAKRQPVPTKRPERQREGPPDWMSERQKAIWRELAETAPAGCLRYIPTLWVNIWVSAYMVFQEASAYLASPPPTAFDDRRVRSACETAMKRQRDLMRLAEAGMGFVPVIRSYVPATCSPDKLKEISWEELGVTPWDPDAWEACDASELLVLEGDLE